MFFKYIRIAVSMIFCSVLILLTQFSFAFAGQDCQLQMNQGLQKQGVDSTVAKSQDVNSEDYKKKRDALYQEFKIMARHAKDDGLSIEGKELVTKLAFRQSLGEQYVTKEEYQLLKKLGYYDPTPVNTNSDKSTALTIKDKIGNFFKNVIVIAKNVFNSVKGAVTGNYDPPAGTAKLAKDLIQFRKQYGIHEGDGFDLLINGNRSFDTIVSGQNDAFRAFLEKNRVQAYEIRKSGNSAILVEFNDQCAPKQVVFIDKNKGSDWSSTLYSYYTSNYCKDLSQIEAIKKDLPSDNDPNEYHFRCKEQGASYDCDCPMTGVYINPWVESCLPKRKMPAVTAHTKFEKFSQERDSIPGYFYSRSTYDKSKERCKTVSSIVSASDGAKDSGTDTGSIK